MKNMLSEIKWFFQRLSRGYDDADVWNYCNFAIRKLRPVFKAFIKMNPTGYPSGLPFIKTCDTKAHSKWQDILNKIELAMDLYWADEQGASWSTKEYHRNLKKMQEGFELFGKYFMHLWD